MLILRAIGIAAIFTAASGSVFADDCKLREVASLDITWSQDGRILVPVQIQGTPEMMMIDTGSPITILDPVTAATLQLKTMPIGQGQLINSRGQSVKERAEISEIGLGHSRASDVRVLIAPSTLTDDKSLAGLLGADLLRNYDIEIDPTAGKLNLFSQDHCEGKVIYWPADAVAVVPLRIALSGHIEMPVELDGKSLNAIFDTGARDTLLNAETAADVFGITSGTKRDSTTDSEGLEFQHIFNSLDFDGIAISHPDVVIWEDLAARAMRNTPQTGTHVVSRSEAYGQEPMIVGMHVVRHLHLFISYKEQKLYITPAATAAPAASAGH